MIKLEKRYLDFSELCSRWKIKSDDLHYLIANNDVIPSIFVVNELTRLKIDPDESSLAPSEDQSFSFRASTYRKFLYLHWPRRDNVKHYYFTHVSTACDPKMPWNSDYEDGKAFWYLLDERIAMNDVEQQAVFMMDTVQAFENKNSADEPSKRPQASDLLEKERGALLNIIGAMLELMRTPRPNRNSDAAIIKELVDNYGDKHGISKSNLERKFPEAKRSLGSG